VSSPSGTAAPSGATAAVVPSSVAERGGGRSSPSAVGSAVADATGRRS
jgi:hypothetical protein